MDRKKVYSEKLRDPRWQKKRLEIFQRDNFCCQMCFDSTSTLHVHHRRYFPGREPWEYEEQELVTLCESCHGEEQSLWPEAMAQLANAFVAMGYFSYDVQNLAAAIFSSGHDHPQYFLSLVSLISEDRDTFELVSDRFREWVKQNRSETVTPER